MAEQNLASEILAELKSSIKRLWIALFIALGVIAAIVIGFLVYISQWDYTTTYEAVGAYAIIDSQGTVIASDFTAEEIQKLLEEASKIKSDSGVEG